jgi:CheY-like chemotaxis protein
VLLRLVDTVGVFTYRPPSRAAVTGTHTDERRRLTVLVVDDDEAIRENLGEALAYHGFEVEAVANGQLALEWLRGRSDRSPVVLLDLMMPVLNGEQFLELMRADPQLARLPVLVMTAGGGCAEVRARFAIEDCFPKPLSLAKLVQAIQACGARAA